ncbi:MAG: acyl-CoA thioesterase [Gulosibacter sp.]|uniref:acyl-CoA thioesterase n=1 Tax=Gulosibacter sp. TaxID=2817531 RepID=UPI003F90ECC8
MIVYSHRVRYHEVDQQGFLFNGRFFEIADVAMAEFFRAIGWSYRELNEVGADPSVVKAEANFVAPAKYDDLLDADVRCTHVGTSSFILETTVRRDLERIAELTLTYVNVDAAAAKSVPLPDAISGALRDQWAVVD